MSVLLVDDMGTSVLYGIPQDGRYKGSRVGVIAEASLQAIRQDLLAGLKPRAEFEEWQVVYVC